MSFVEGTRGRRFSQLYLEQGAPMRDSPRMRRRLAAIWPTPFESRIAGIMYERLGESVPSSQFGGYFWDRYFSQTDLHNVLDAITIAVEVLRRQHSAQQFLSQVATIFLEENVGYRVDTDGVVHFAVDVEYERAVSSVIYGLDNPRYGAVLAAFTRIQVELDKDPPDGTHAIRASFNAVEVLFRLMFSRAPRLAGSEIEKYLKPLVAERSTTEAEKLAAARWLNSFKEWVEACHFYRHGQGHEEPHQPPLDLAIALISSGASFLRWLVSHDQPAAAEPQTTDEV